MPSRTHVWWYTGGILVVFASAVVSPISGLLLLLMSLATLALLWKKGAINPPPLVAQKRRDFLNNQSPKTNRDRAVLPQAFCYEAPNWLRSCLWLIGILLSLGGAVTLFACVTTPEARPALALGIISGGFGLLVLRFAWRLPQLGVRIGPREIAVEGIIGCQRLAWEDVVLLTRRQYSVYGKPLQVDYVLYGIDRSITFSSKLPHSQELLAVLENNLPPAALAFE